mmetsp:Transcript_13217/g.25054  ORF Transcript_13217/g.25054 Transcript_13217/m.25054 type:complete len:95 (+) Transcript_13217:632-916(+)
MTILTDDSSCRRANEIVLEMHSVEYEYTVGELACIHAAYILAQGDNISKMAAVCDVRGRFVSRLLFCRLRSHAFPSLFIVSAENAGQNLTTPFF